MHTSQRLMWKVWQQQLQKGLELQVSLISFLSFFLSFMIFFFNVDQFLKYLFNLLQYCLCFLFWFFGQEAGETLAPQPGIESAAPCIGRQISVVVV